ncbi:MAG: FHA domain-containing protein [Bdellovibrionales bacterium]|nr:FHA domain-containing protein [Bdellovibrionales bacterium]
MNEQTLGSKKKLLPTNLGVLVEFVEGSERGRVIPLIFQKTVFGRKHADIIVRDPSVSSSHAAIEYANDQFSIMDLGSSNGTFVGSKQIKHAIIAPGDEIKIGKTLFRLKKNQEMAKNLINKQAVHILAQGGGLSALIDNEFIESDERTDIQNPLTKPTKPEEKTINLRISLGNDQGKSFCIKKPNISIGRVNSDVVLKDVDVSRKHAIIELVEGGQVVLRDLASSNGTYVNKRRIDNCVIFPNDIIQVGNTLIVFEGVSKA